MKQVGWKSLPRFRRRSRTWWVAGALAALALALLLVAWLAGRDDAGTPQVVWHPIHHGLESYATILALAADPLDPQTLYAGAYHQTGLYKSTDGGMHWQVADRGVEGRAVYSLLALPQGESAGTAIYAGATDGLYRSDDAGQTWSRVEAVPSVAVFALTSDGAGRLYCGTDGHGIRRGAAVPTAAGTGPPAYTQIPVGGPPTDQVVLALAVSADGGTILVGTNGWGVRISHDGGETWQSALEQTFVSEVALSPDDPGVAYARTRKGLHRTSDGGHSWTFCSEGIEKRIDALAIDPMHPETIYAGVSGSGVWRSRDGGETWQKTGPGIRPWAAILDLLVLRSPDPVLYAGAWDGVYRSTDEGRTWQRLARGLGDVLVRALALHPEDPQALFVADIDGLHLSTDGGETWTGLAPGPLDKGYLSLAFSPSSPEIAYAGSNGGGVARSSDGGQTWEIVDSTLKTAIPGLLVHPTDPERLLARVSFDRVYESRDGGMTWTPTWDGLGPDREVISLGGDPTNPAVIYAGTDQGLYVTRDGGREWHPLGSALTPRTVYCTTVDPNRPRTLYVGTTDGPFRSEDGGQTWQRWGRGLESITVTTISFDPARHGTVYAGTKYQGVYWSLDGGQTWQPVGLADTSVETLVLHPTGTRLFAATSRGLYRGEVAR